MAIQRREIKYAAGWGAGNKEPSMTMDRGAGPISDPRQEEAEEEVNPRRKPERGEKTNPNEGSRTMA